MHHGRYILVLCALFLPFLCCANIVITNGLTHTYSVSGGTVYSGSIRIENTAETAQNVRLYKQDYRYTADGLAYYEDPGANERSNFHWIDLNTNLLTLEPHGKAEVLYEITVPDEMLAGSYWSVVMVEPVPDIRPSDEAPHVQIRSIVRYAIQVITTNDQPAESMLLFTDVQLQEKDEQLHLDLAVSNEGELFHVVEVSMTLFDGQSGENKGTFRSSKMSLLPQNAKRFTVPLPGVLTGQYQASVVATTQDERAYGIHIDLEIPDE